MSGTRVPARAAALPFMEDLHRVTGQHILLAVRDGHEAVLVERLSARDAAAVKYRVGGRLPLTETGIGIALLAHVVTLGVAVADGSAWVADVAVGGRRQRGRYSSNQGSPSGLRAWPTCCRRWILSSIRIAARPRYCQPMADKAGQRDRGDRMLATYADAVLPRLTAQKLVHELRAPWHPACSSAR